MINRQYIGFINRLRKVKLVVWIVVWVVICGSIGGYYVTNMKSKSPSETTNTSESVVVAPQVLKSDSKENQQVFNVFKIGTKDISKKPLLLKVQTGEIVKITYTNEAEKKGSLSIPGLNLKKIIPEKTSSSIEFSEQNIWSYDILFSIEWVEKKIWTLQVVLK